MKIERVHLVSDEDLKILSRTIKSCVKNIVENKEDAAVWTLERLEKNINETLKESKL